MHAASTMVKFLGDDGKVRPADARKLLGIDRASTVVVWVIASGDAAGNLSIADTGVLVRR